ncbi:hypothetical protein IG631_14390 [Alternaria alternata]|nr:hypothetical protein IG631_14390 [Alternaria alternata]
MCDGASGCIACCRATFQQQRGEKREKFVRPLNFLKHGYHARGSGLRSFFIFSSPLVPAWITAWLGRGFSGDRIRKVAL